MIQDHPTHNRRGLFWSIAVHGALIVWMLNLDIMFEVEPPEFFELSLGAVSRQRIEQIMDEAAAQQQALTPEERIEVPERRMLEIEEPTISVPQEQRIESADIVTNATKLATELETPRPVSPVRPTDLLTMDRKESFQGSQITVGEQPGAGIETGVIGADEAINFTIEGEIEGRQLLSNPLPRYPEGLNRNATIQISFAVLPNGAVSAAGMVPVRKENAVLEDLAMTSLKLWRFSPLPEQQQETQRGVITFVFRVE